MTDHSYTTVEAAAVLGVGKTSLWRYIKQGQLAARRERYGLAWRYAIAETELRRFSNQYQTQFDLSALPDT